MNRGLKTLTLLLVFAANFAQAQRSKVELGIEGGPSLTNLRGSNIYYDYKPVIYGSAGFTFQYNFSPTVSLRTALNYEGKGFKSPIQHNNYPNIGDTLRSTFYSRFDYLTIPLMMRFTFGEKIRFFFNVGAYASILFEKKDHGTSVYFPYVYGGFVKDPAKNYDHFDLGISAGFGIGIPINEHWDISLEVRDNFGLTDIQSKENNIYNPGYGGSKSSARTNSGILLLGLSYHLKPRNPDKPAFLQNDRLVLGIEGGPNVSPFTESRAYKNNDHTHSAIKPGYAGTVGLSLQWNSKKRFSLRTGLSFEQNKYSFNTNYVDYGTTQSGHGSGSSHFEYLKLPILARFTYGKKVHFFFNTGVFFSLLTKQTEFAEGTNYHMVGGTFIGSSYKKEFSDISNYKKIDFGVVGGLGIGIPVQKRWYFSLEARDNFGISNILLKNSYDRSLRTNSLNLLVGVSYKLGFREESK